MDESRNVKSFGQTSYTLTLTFVCFEYDGIAERNDVYNYRWTENVLSNIVHEWKPK